MKAVTVCTKIIEYSFYSLFLLVPLVFSGNTSELFELNKMWLTFGLTIIVGAAWASKMVIEKRFYVQRTPLDIPILLFLVSQIIATLFSMDPHVSWWGYYSRFNGGLLSTISYLILYYAFVSNLQLKHVMRTLKVTLVAGFITALWGFPAHFGYDPTCLMFRGTLDTNCWTEAFQPTVRTFSTLGQPAWFAAYLALLIPIAMAYAITNYKFQITNHKQAQNHNNQNTKQKRFGHWNLFGIWNLEFGIYFSLAMFFYVNLLFTNTRAGFIAFCIANLIFWLVILAKQYFSKKHFLRNFLIFNITFGIITFILGTPIAQLNKITLPSLTAAQDAPEPADETFTGAPPIPGTGVTDSGDIRLLVWEGAIDAWKQSPIFGTGVETFASAYYKHKPAGHNLTSEWDYLYNKAHNEYLNYLTTTGIFGLGSYLFLLGLFIVFVTKHFFNNLLKHLRKRDFAILKHIKVHEISAEDMRKELFILGLFCGWISILITNFFGFSVVIINLYLFFIPIFIFYLTAILKNYPFLTFPAHTTDQSALQNSKSVSAMRWTMITVVVIVAGWLSIVLLTYRQADVAYALGSNLNKTGNYQKAYPLLTEAVQIKPNEPVYKDELSINLAALAAGLYTQNDATNAAQVAESAIMLSNEIIENHPNNVVYWKNRVRLFYTLSASDTQNQEQYLMQALNAINKARELAPNDAKIAYNQGVLYGQTGDLDKAIEILQETVELKPNYTDVYIALGLFYREQAVDENDTVINPEKNQQAVETYRYILENLSPGNEEVQTSLDEWENS